VALPASVGDALPDSSSVAYPATSTDMRTDSLVETILHASIGSQFRL